MGPTSKGRGRRGKGLEGRRKGKKAGREWREGIGEGGEVEWGDT